MFQFPEFPTLTYVFSKCFILLQYECFHIRIPAGRSLFAAHRSFSQLIASFIGSWCQGIHLMLFFAWTIFQTLLFSLVPLNCLSFSNILFFGLLIHCEKVLSFCALNRYSTFRWNCTFTQIGKTYNFYFANLVKNICPLICSFLLFNILYSVFNEHRYSLSLFTKWIVKSE